MRIAIVEISKSHEECIYTQASFLKDAGYSISLIAHSDVIKQANSYVNIFDSVEEVSFKSRNYIKSISYQVSLAKQLAKFDKVIFNTASSSKKLRNIALFLKFYKVNVIGVLHDAKRLEKSFTQKIFSIKIKKYFVLNDFIKENYKIDTRLNLESFYPIYFPSYNTVSIKKGENEIWITIPGRLYYNRRNYKFLIEQLHLKEINKSIKFIILGDINTKDGLDFLSEVRSLQLDVHFIFFNKFISNDEYYSYIEKSDYILPLLNLNDKSYLKSKITGTFNMAFGFKKVMICNEELGKINDIKENSILYKTDSLINILNDLKTDNMDVFNGGKWEYEFQKEKYLTFI